MRVLREQVLIPLGFAIVVIGGGAIWLGNTYAKVTNNTAEIATIKSQHTSYNQHFLDIKAELGEIRGELKRIRK